MFDISYTNLMMLQATIPDYSKDKDEDEFFEDLADENDFTKFFNYN